jgi:hypothetical protein
VATQSFAQLSMPFTGTIQYNQVKATSSDLPNGATLNQGQTYTFHVLVTNTGQAPQAFFLDPRTSGMSTYQLADQNGSDQNMSLPLALPSDPATLPPIPLYVVPADTTEVDTGLTGNAPVTYDFSPFSGDPDLSQALTVPPTGNSSALNFVPTGGEVTPGLWSLVPSEVGPYGPSGASPVTASATFSVVTPSFDSTVNPSTGDLWSAYAGQSSLGSLHPVYLLPGQSRSISLTIKPTATVGATVSGTIKVADTFQADFLEPSLASASFLDPGIDQGGDEVASLPYSYTVG